METAIRTPKTDPRKNTGSSIVAKQVKPISSISVSASPSASDLLEDTSLEKLKEIKNLFSELEKLQPAPTYVWRKKKKKKRKVKINISEIAQEKKGQLIDLINEVRYKIDDLTQSDLSGPKGKPSPETVDEIKGNLFIDLNKLTPYYYQKKNLNVLHFFRKAKKDEEGVEREGKKGKWVDVKAGKHTCNITSLSMTLEALGLKPKDLAINEADKERLVEIANISSSHIENQEEYKNYNDLVSERMPNFLQFVAILLKYRPMKGPIVKKKVNDARKATLASRGGITSIPFLVQIAKKFNISIEKEPPPKPGSKSKVKQGYDSAFKKKIREEKAKLGAGEELTKERRKEIYKEFKKEKISPVELQNYKDWIDKNVIKKIQEGKQVICHKKGHYVRFISVIEKGIIVDDPFFDPGQDKLVKWKPAYKQLYFQNILILSR